MRYSNNSQQNTTNIKDKNNYVLTENEKIERRLNEYFEDLLNAEREKQLMGVQRD